ncbi:MAG: Protein translocase subunit SecY [Candidatus Giovannonibacteria bacterium GW2011_GWA2_53_7]|uniref:Protein translocase subunit SecY n=1 Tax=Candidatus Giovannonibacteria bacterium GW2011_GWA2_53_7 TaxID=1618650 RepID=A0A0G1XTR9_9BACT|nr:MAG: Protein translocase subunit SecY [Candidatus Giovannonibacteria bacterium GW2011_GWA2_53_7]
MWETFTRKVRLVFEDEVLRRRIVFVLFALVIFRLLAAVPVPGVNAASLEAFLNNNQFFGLLNVFSGGGFSNLSIVMLGVGPYITASIVMHLDSSCSSSRTASSRLSPFSIS